MSIQNPTLPTQTDPRGIDAALVDLQQFLDVKLGSWLTNGMGRAYRLSKVRANQSTVFLPEVYLGGDKYKYFAATPDNDKTGQNIFIVGDETDPDQRLGQYGRIEYPLSIIFNANLEKVDATLLLTENFTEHLIEDVRNALKRDLLGKTYRITINNVVRRFEDVYTEFDVQNDRGVSYLPMTHFRFNCTISVKEECGTTPFDACTSLLGNLTESDKLDCILPTYDFSTMAVQAATSAQQQVDMSDWLCSSPLPTNIYSTMLNGTDQVINTQQALAEYDLARTDSFTFIAWVKPTTAFQEGDIINKFAAPTGYYLREKSNGKIRFVLAENSAANISVLDVESSGTMTLNAWNKIAVSYTGGSDPASVSLYINDVLQTNTVNVDTLSGPINNAAEILKFGANTAQGRYFKGLVNVIRMWDFAMTLPQIQDESVAGAPVIPSTFPMNSIVDFYGGDESLYCNNSRAYPDGQKTNAQLDSYYSQMNGMPSNLMLDVP